MHALCPMETVIIDGIKLSIFTGTKDWYERLLRTVGNEIGMKVMGNGLCRVDWHAFQRLDSHKREEITHALVATNILSIHKEGNREVVTPAGDSLMPTMNGMPTFFNEDDHANPRLYCSSFPNIPLYHLYRVRKWDMDGEQHTDTA